MRSLLAKCDFAGRVILLAAVMSGLHPLGAAPLLERGKTNSLTLRDFLQSVIERNETLHSRLLEFEISQRRFRAERGVFEPELVLSYDLVSNKRENTAEQRRSSGVAVFEEKNNIYNAGIEALVPTGAKIRLGYTLRDLRNNLQDPIFGSIVTNSPDGEFQSFAGVSLTQPLLKNAWYPATMANIRLAALGSDVAYQEYRRQMMLIVSTAEATYWNLYLTQEQARFFRDSVRLAEQLLLDTQARVKAGKGSELEVLEAQAGLALRNSKSTEAEQKYFETAAQLLTLMAHAGLDSPPVLEAVDQPADPAQAPPFFDSGQTALELNPDYLGQMGRLKQENIRVAYAKNQRLPQLDLRASYGLNGLGPDPGSSWDDIQTHGFPSYAVGAELRFPLSGGIRGRNDLDAARLRKQQALAGLKETETQVLNAIDTALRKLRGTASSAKDYESVVAFNQSLLDTERARLEAGTVSSQRVLDVDAALFEARNAVVEAKVLHERARLELELVQGTLLRSRNLDLPQKELEQRTTVLLKQAGVSEEQYHRLAKELQLRYDPRPAPAANTKPSN
jgi:outer membrane protein TolC